MMLVSVLPRGMVEEPTQDDRAACAATGGRAEGIVEARAIGSQGIEIRCLNLGVAVAASRRALIVSDDQDDVLLRSKDFAGDEKQKHKYREARENLHVGSLSVKEFPK